MVIDTCKQISGHEYAEYEVTDNNASISKRLLKICIYKTDLNSYIDSIREMDFIKS